MNLTIIIPTYNRPANLEACLTYLEQIKLLAKVVVVDGSVEESAKENQRIILAKRPATRYIRGEGVLHPLTRCCLALAEVSTPYCVVCADDDFMIPSALSRCIDFLDVNPDYSSAQGTSLRLPSSEGAAGWGRNSIIGNLDMDCPVERVIHHLSSYAHTCYAVHRTAVLQKSLHFAGAAPFVSLDGCLWLQAELAQSICTVVQGKSAWLPMLYICRTPTIGDRQDEQEYCHPNFSKCVAAIKQYALFPLENDPKQIKEASQLYDLVMGKYLAKRKVSLTSKSYSFWPWKGSRQTFSRKPSLSGSVRELAKLSEWTALKKAYPDAIPFNLKSKWSRNLYYRLWKS